MITKPEFFRFYEADRDEWHHHKAKHKRKKGGGDFYATQNTRLSRRFSSAVVRAAQEGRLLYREAYRLTGMKGDTFRKYSDLVLKRMRNKQQ